MCIRDSGDAPSFDKYDGALPPDLLRRAYAADRLRTDELEARLYELYSEFGGCLLYTSLFGTNTMKADEILSDFSKGMIIRFFYRRKSPLPYACTAT